MKRKEGGRWETVLALAPGRYEYKFVVDDEWIHDPNARENVPNEEGSLNSVMEVRGWRAAAGEFVRTGAAAKLRSLAAMFSNERKEPKDDDHSTAG